MPRCRNFTPKQTPDRNTCACVSKHMCRNVHCWVIHNSQNTEMTSGDIMIQQNTTQQWKWTVKCNHVGDSHRQVAEKRPDTEESTLHGSIYMKFKNRLNETIMMDVTIDCDFSIARAMRKPHIFIKFNMFCSLFCGFYEKVSRESFQTNMSLPLYRFIVTVRHHQL